eukprot:7387803-Prymnesium_polylepis.1
MCVTLVVPIPSSRPRESQTYRQPNPRVRSLNSVMRRVAEPRASIEEFDVQCAMRNDPPAAIQSSSAEVVGPARVGVGQ